MSIQTPEEQKFVEAIQNNMTIAGVLRSMNFAVVGSGYKKVKKIVSKFNVDTSHWLGQKHGTSGKKLQVPFSDVLIQNSPYPLNSKRKNRLIKEGLLNNKCQVCGLEPFWNEGKLTLVLDHINGVRNDNRIENLRLLCPNCDSQQDTFCGRNKKAHVS